MISYSINFVGFQLLLLSYTAQSFVLLTANIDDIKKLARKFVSESLADKLTDFVVKATEQMNDQMQETPNQKDIKTHDISASNEYELRNLVKHKEEEKQQTTRRDRHEYTARTTRKKERQKPNYLSNESKELSIEKEERLLANEKKWQKNIEESKERRDKEKPAVKNWRDEFENSKEFELPIQTKPKRYWSMEKNEMANNDVFSHELSKNSQYGNKDEKNKEHYQSKPSESFYKDLHKDLSELKQYSRLTTPHSYLPTFKPSKTVKSESKQDERISDSFESHLSGTRYKKIKDRDTNTFSFDFKLPKSQRQKHDDRKYSAESLSNLKIKYNKDRDSKQTKFDKDRLWDIATTRFRGQPNIYDGVTTKKEKTDFDQYDNRNYPKAELIGTSGPLMLPKMTPNYYKQTTSQERAWWEKDLKLHDNVAQLKTWLATM